MKPFEAGLFRIAPGPRFKLGHQFQRIAGGVQFGGQLDPGLLPFRGQFRGPCAAGGVDAGKGDAEKASLKGLQNLIRENNISLERQKRSTVSNEIRSAVYLVTMLKDCLIKREIIGKELQNFEDKKKLCHR